MRTVNASRRKKEWARAYGSADRVAFVKTLRCVASPLGRCDGPIENAHTRNGGRGRKADYAWIVPLCAGHHRAYDERRGVFGQPGVRLVLENLAWGTELSWREQLRGAEGDTPPEGTKP